MRNGFLYSILALALLGLDVPAQAQPLILRTSVVSAGGQQSTGGPLILQSTIGEPGVGQMTGGNLLLDGGFWPQVTGAAGPLALPTAANDIATTDEDTAVAIDVLANDTDPADGTLTIVAFGTPEHGEVAQTGDATFTYTPEADFFGEDQFSYTVQNEQGGRAQATVTITVNPVNDAPVFTSTPVAGIGIDTAYRYVAKAIDIEGDALTFTAPTVPAWLALAEQTDSTVTLVGMPTAAEAGEHAVTLAVSDGQASAEQAFTVIVTATAPGISTLLLPEDDALVDPTNGIPLAWRAVSGAASYDLQLATVDDFSSFESFIVGISDTTWTLFGLDDNLIYFWRIRAVNSIGNGDFTDAFRFSTGVNVATEDETGVPSAFALHQNYPNPFNPATTLAYDLPQSAAVTLTVYDVQGREVRRFVQGVQPAGRHELHFEAGDLGSGTYFYRLEAGSFSQTRSFVLLK
ncbi:MAG TPA: tandem-95 repeat protein [Rhodothermales bacterium]|nr:tandem-95 repeat protein [Rhodothermales bacterium]